ncbi:MAG: HYR domain-containing protein [Bacteroidota bacterium]|nr:HYR domain-containing protein [Bacteroidota bacterium]
MKEIFALCGSTGVQNKVFFRRSLLIAVVFCFCIFPAVAQILPVVTVRFNNPRYACDNQTYRVDAEFRSDKPGLRLYSMNVRFCHETTALDYLGLGELAPGYTRYSPNPAQEEFWEGTPFGFPGTSAVTYINGAIQLADYTEDPILLPTGNGEWVKLFSIFFKVMDPGIIANGFCPVLIWDLQEVNSNGGFKIGSDGVTITCLDPPLYYIDGEPIYEQSKPVTEMAVQFNWIYDNDGNPATYGYPVPSVCIYGDTNPPVVSESDGSSKVECPDDIVEPEYPFASDNCSEQLTPVLESIIDTPDPLSCEGTRVYTYKYTGSTGLTAYWKYTYHILRTTPPRESGGPALTAAAVQCQDDALTPQLPEIRDVCGTILKAPEPVVTHSGGEYGGTITYDYVYIDCAGLEYPWRFTYTVMDDQPPTASNPADIVLTGCNSTFPAPDPLVVTDEADNCGVPVVAWVSDGPPVTEGCTETVIRTYSVTDGCNNQIRVTQKLIRMVDTQAPTASNPADIVLTGCNSTFPAPDPLVVTDEADNCGVPVVAWVSDGPPVTEGCTETIIRTYSVTDGCNNLIRVTQKLIRIVDGEDPVIPCPADVVLWVSAGETSTTWTPVIPEAFDNCTASATLTVTGVRSDGKPLIDPWPLGTTTITWNTEDGCGNSAVSCFQKVTVTVGEGCLTLVAKVFLEGALIDPVTSTEYATVMRTTLNDLQMLPGQAYDNGGTIIQTPAGQPYNTAPWFYDGQEGMFFDAGGTAGDAGYPAEVVDWVLVSLRNTAGAGYQKICEKAALLLSDGTIRMVEGFDCCDLDMNGSYYLVVEHRNHLPVMSHEPVQVAGAILTYDFTRQQSYVEAGSAMAGQKEYGGYFFMYGGNGNQYTTSFSDTDINADDKTTWELNNGLTGYRKGDYNMNGDTNSNDEILWQRNNGRGTSVIRDY